MIASRVPAISKLSLAACAQARGFVSSLAAASANAYDSALVRSVLAAGLYPQLGRVLPAPRRGPPSLLTSRGQKVHRVLSSLSVAEDLCLNAGAWSLTSRHGMPTLHVCGIL